MKVAIFHHLLPVNDWEVLYSEQMHRLCASGLYNEAEFIHIGFNCLEQNLPFTLEKIKLNRNHIHADDVDTLTSLYNFCLNNPDYKILYFTNLGVTKNHPITRLNKSGWRLMLEYFNIDNWKQCIELLDSYDCVGAESHSGNLIIRGSDGSIKLDLGTSQGKTYSNAKVIMKNNGNLMGVGSYKQQDAVS